MVVYGDPSKLREPVLNLGSGYPSSLTSTEDLSSRSVESPFFIDRDDGLYRLERPHHRSVLRAPCLLLGPERKGKR